MADAVQVDTTKLCMELSLDILANQDSVCVPLESLEDIKKMIADNTDSTRPQRRRGQFELEDDKDLELGAMVVHAQSQQPSLHVPHVLAHADRSEQPLDEDARVERLFPNSFKITGFKHICDNALGSTLQAIPQ